MSAAFSMSSISGQSVRDVIDQRAAQAPNQVFLIDPTTRQTLTFRDLHDAARVFAARLKAEGCQPGDRIAYAMENGADAVRVLLGAMYGGYVATAINLVSGLSTISYVLEHSEARLVFVDDNTAASVAEAVGTLTTVPRSIAISTDWFEGEGSELDSVDAASDSLLMYTSGTTGKPKGVLHTHESILAGGGNTALAHELTSNDRALCVLPVYHINGLCVTVMGPLVSAASSALAPDVQSAFESKFDIPIVETMGLTETAAQILSNPLPPGTRKIGSPGLAYGNEVLIADPNQKELPRGEEGEVIVKGANVMRVYRNNDAATAASLTEEGWLRTGDLGRMDEDGYIFITGRLKELIIKGGENIAPREIDDVLYSHPDVIEAAAFARPCDSYGQTVEAGVQIHDGSELTEADLLELCRASVGPFKTPDRIHFLPELPKGPSGKIQRIKLAELVLAS